MDGLIGFGTTLLTMLRDVLPIAAILFGFQALVLRRKIKDPARVAMGMFWCCWVLRCFWKAWMGPCFRWVG